MIDAPAQRKHISRSARFEVFKRDSFACQYCGASAPTVLLVIDHIKPVAEGGDNDITNLITACQPCNAGKGARELNDHSVIERQKKQLDDLSERRAQLEMMMEWRKGLLSLEDEKFRIIESVISCKAQFVPNEIGRQKILKWMKKYEVDEILGAVDTAFLQYLEIDGDGKATSESWNTAFDSVPKIIGVNRSAKEKPYLPDMLYIRGILRNRLSYVNERNALAIIESAIVANASIDSLKRLAKTVSSWTKFVNAIDDYLDAQDNSDEAA